LINEATKNIADSEELIANVLIPQRDQLTTQIADLERRIEETKVHITTQTENRAVSHSEFLVRIEESNEAIAVLDEALKVLAQLEEGNASLLQVKRVHKTMEKVSSVL
jgi:chromosome segregation ATPase